MKGTTFVLLSLGKELRETLRDRRTLAIMVLFPLVVYPVLALLGTQVVASRERTQEARPSLVAVTGPESAPAAEVKTRLQAAPKLFTLAPAGSRPADVEAGRLDAVVALTPLPGERARAELLFDSTRDESRRAEDRLRTTLGGLLPESCAPRFELSGRDLAPGTKLGGYVLSKALPLMILLMVLLGAFYPAIDVTAGERERGTLETILASPMPRFHLLLGKVLAVTTLAAATGFLNLGSMSITLVQVVRLADPATALPIPWTRAAAAGLVVVPTAFLLASLFVAVGSLARGFKEAQNLLIPVYFVFFAPAMLGALGEFPLSGLAAVAPGLNVTLLARDLVQGEAGAGAVVLVLGSTLVYGALALAAAARLYASERFLTADGEGEEKRLRARGDGSKRTDPPTPGEALALFALGYLMLYFVFIPLQRRDMVSGLMISQWAGLLGVVLLFARATGRRLLGPVLNLRRPSLPAVAGAVLMGAVGWLVVDAVALWLLPPPKEYLEQLRRALFPLGVERPLVVSLFLFALTPAICEEVFFRGAILRGLLSRVGPAGAIVTCGVLFGLFHVDVWRLLPTTLLGVMLSWIAWRGGSLAPAVIAHFVNNGVLVTLGAVGVEERFETLAWTTQASLVVGGVVILAAGAWLVTRANDARAQL